MEKIINNTNFERGFSNRCCCSETQQYENINISCAKLYVNNWLSDIESPLSQNRYVEVRFKNTRKDIFENTSELNLKVGDIVAVEASPGHDIGIVSAVGQIALVQIRKYKKKKLSDIKKIYRIAKPIDIEKWKDAISLEMPTLHKTREFANELEIDMKLSDVEFQGDKTKAIFYYIAEERVDFRKLIKKMAEKFKIKIEMKQIGARQEAGRVGGIGACGRELCCSTWLHDFDSVSTNAARCQELSLNPQKLTGQCSKLKCCLNNELSVYMDARKIFPQECKKITTDLGDAYHVKNDIFNQIMHFEVKINEVTVIRSLHVNKVKEIMELNKKGIIPENIFDGDRRNNSQIVFDNSLNSDNIQRFYSESSKSSKKRKRKKDNANKEK